MTRSIRPRIAGLTCLCLACLIIPSTSLALGLGAYLEFGHGEGEVDFFGVDEIDFDDDQYGVGFALDTNLAMDRLFNYRMNFGYQHTNRDFDNADFGGLTFVIGNADADGFSFNNTFGIALSRGPQHRLWAGPAIRLGVDVFDTGTSDVDIVDVAIGGGPAIGVNIHASDLITIGLTASYQYLHIEEIVHVDSGVFDDTESFDGHEHLASVNLTVFFRMPGDRYR